MTTAPPHGDQANAFDALERGVYAALETYANVHRGSGHHSMVSTHLFELSRGVILSHLGLSRRDAVVVFGSRRSIDALAAALPPGRRATVSSRDLGLPLGVCAIGIERRALPKGRPIFTGGGTARLVGPDWVMWAQAPDRFEAGTPAVINVIAFALALLLTRRLGERAFASGPGHPTTASGILYHDAFDRLSGRELLEALRRALVGRGMRVPTVEGDRPYVNLDNAASTQTFEPVWDAVRQSWRQTVLVQQEIVSETRAIVAGVVGAPASSYEVIFTANTTEAINLVAEDAARASSPVIVNTLLEHNSNELPWRGIPGSSQVRLPMDAEGFVDLDTLETILRDRNERGAHGGARVTLVAVSGASNVLGVCNDLAAIARITHRYGARVLVDAAQLIAHRAVDMEATGIDFLAFSAHKVYAPFGTGVLVAKKGLLGFDDVQRERIRSSGDENVSGIAALGKALVLLQRVGFDVVQDEERALTARALRGMAKVPGLRIHGIADPASPSFASKGGVIPFDLKGNISHGVARLLATRAGIGVRSGCHCAHLTVKRMLEVPPWAEQLQRLILIVARRFELPGVARASLGLATTAEDVDVFVQALRDIAGSPRAAAPDKAARQRLVDACDAAARRVFGSSPAIT